MICFSGWPEARQTLHCAWRALPPWPWTPSPVSQCLDGALPTSGEIRLPNLSLHNPIFQSEGLAPSLAGGLCPLRDGGVSPRSPFLLWELGRYQSRPELQVPSQWRPHPGLRAAERCSKGRREGLGAGQSPARGQPPPPHTRVHFGPGTTPASPHLQS